MTVGNYGGLDFGWEQVAEVKAEAKVCGKTSPWLLGSSRISQENRAREESR